MKRQHLQNRGDDGEDFEMKNIQVVACSWQSYISDPEQGFQGEADELYIRAFEIGEKAIGTDHPDLAAILNNMAALLQKEVRRCQAVVYA